MKKLLSLILTFVLMMSVSGVAMAAGVPCSAACTEDTHVAAIGTTHYADLQEALKALTGGDTLTVLRNINITEPWDARFTGGKVTVPVTIDGNGHTITITSSVNDAGNHFAFFRFEADAAVKNLTMDMSGAPEAWSNRFRAISAKGNLTVDNCIFIGNPAITNTRAIIFGEGAGDDAGNLEVSITGSTFTNWKNGISDNENSQDVKSVDISGNTFNNANVSVSARESIVFTNNKLDSSSSALLHSYTNKVAGSTEKGKPNSLTVSGNSIDGKNADGVENGELIQDPANTDAPISKPSSGSGIKVKYEGGNSFSTSRSAVPTSVEIDGKPVSFKGDGKRFTVNCVKADSKWITVRWNSTSVTVNFRPDAKATCTNMDIPKTGDASVIAYAVMAMAAAAGMMLRKEK